LWVLTVAGVETYDEIPGDVLPDYVLRQVVFNALVLLALARDILRLSRAPAQQSIGAMAP